MMQNRKFKKLTIFFMAVLQLILLSACGSGSPGDSEEWDVLYPFQDQYNDLMGFKDADGNVVIEPQFISAGRFSEGLAFIRDVDGNDGFIDTSGNVVISIPATTSVVSGFSEGFARVIPRRWRSDEKQRLVGVYGPFIFIDRTGENAFGMEFGHAFSFEDGLALVTLLNGNQAFIDRTGKNAFEVEFKRAFHHIDGLAVVHLLNGNRAYINRAGENAFGMEFTSAFEFDRRGYAKVVLLDGTATYIDRDGNLHLDRIWG